VIFSEEGMRILPPELNITEREGFDASKDLFGRAELGAGLARLLAEVEDPMVMVLDAPWGSGKTTFVRMWAGYLRNEGFPVVHFDAFANDYTQDAFLALAAEIADIARGSSAATAPVYDEYIAKAKKAGSVLLRSTAKISAKALTLGALSSGDLTEIGELLSGDVAQEASAIADTYLESRLKGHSEERNAFSEFRKALASLASAMRPSDTERGTSEAHKWKRPLIFIIDELDRCRPPFALELLEKIKHFFSVENVHFVLVTHLGHLETSVQYAYGGNIDATRYLEKFYHITVMLPGDEKDTRQRHRRKYLERLLLILLTERRQPSGKRRKGFH